MKTTLTTTSVITVALLLAFTTVARADLLSGNVAMTTWSTLTADDSIQNVYVTPMTVTNHTTGQENFLLFCGDFLTSTSDAFNYGGGQEYNAFALESPSIDFYTDLQKSQINSLFGHTYSSAFGQDGTILNSVYAQAIQLSIWSILHETSGNYDILDGSFRLSANYDMNVVDATNSILNAVLGYSDWSALGMEEFVDYDLTVYVAEGGKSVSQTLISVTGSPNREDISAATPEPATMLIIGLGLAGLGWTRRMKKRG